MVLTHSEIDQLFQAMQGTNLLMARIIYGCGLRLAECVSLRIKDIDFEREAVTVRAGKGDKDRETVLPSSIKKDMKDHLCCVRILYEQDRERDANGIMTPGALEKKYPNAGKEWGWYWVFPSYKESIDPRSRILRRHHIYPDNLRRAIKSAAQKAGIANMSQFIRCATVLRPIYWKEAMTSGTIQDLLGHTDLRTTMIYTHIISKKQAGCG